MPKGKSMVTAESVAKKFAKQQKSARAAAIGNLSAELTNWSLGEGRKEIPVDEGGRELVLGILKEGGWIASTSEDGKTVYVMRPEIVPAKKAKSAGKPPTTGTRRSSPPAGV